MIRIMAVWIVVGWATAVWSAEAVKSGDGKTPEATAGTAAGPWALKDWRYRVAVDVGASGFARQDKPAEVELNFTELLKGLDTAGKFNEESVRAVEVKAGKADGEVIPCQFDKAEGYDAATSAKGIVVFLMPGATAAKSTRRFHVYFETKEGLPAAKVQPLVTLTDDVDHQGLKSYKIATPKATYIYQKPAGGFASLLDAQGNDWLSYHPGGGPAGEYRGIPNLAHGEGFFHPGGKNCTSKILSAGPLKVTIYSESNDQKWKCTWEILPSYARMTVLACGHPYWFLYEGTPGGNIDNDIDFCVRSDGTKTPAKQSWDQKLGDPEWVYFGDGKLVRMLFLVHHEHDDGMDSYWPMNNAMTVFGFGRQGLGKFMTAVPGHFTIGLSDETDFPKASVVIDSAFRPLTVRVEKPEKKM